MGKSSITFQDLYHMPVSDVENTGRDSGTFGDGMRSHASRIKKLGGRVPSYYRSVDGQQLEVTLNLEAPPFQRAGAKFDDIGKALNDLARDLSENQDKLKGYVKEAEANPFLYWKDQTNGVLAVKELTAAQIEDMTPREKQLYKEAVSKVGPLNTKIKATVKAARTADDTASGKIESLGPKGDKKRKPGDDPVEDPPGDKPTSDPKQQNDTGTPKDQKPNDDPTQDPDKQKPDTEKDGDPQNPDAEADPPRGEGQNPEQDDGHNPGDDGGQKPGDGQYPGDDTKPDEWDPGDLDEGGLADGGGSGVGGGLGAAGGGGGSVGGGLGGVGGGPAGGVGAVTGGGGGGVPVGAGAVAARGGTGGVPMGGMMGGGGHGAGGEGGGGEHTWLSEDEDPFGTGDAAPPVIGYLPPAPEPEPDKKAGEGPISYSAFS